MPILKRLNFLCVVLVGLFLTACQDNKEGCLDPNALNLDVSADVNANCNYPNLFLNISHRWISSGAEPDTLSFSLGSPYVLDSGDTLVVEDLDFYITSVWIGDMPRLTVFDSVERYDKSFLKDDLTIIAPGTIQNGVGHIRAYGDYSGLGFDLGFDDEWQAVDTSLLRRDEAGHPWFNSALKRSANSRFEGRLRFRVQPVDGDIVERTLSFVDMPQADVVLPDGDISNTQATNLTVNLLLKYDEIFQGDLLVTDTTQLKGDLWNNLASSFVLIK